MNLIMTLLVRDEEDIIRHNIEYHLNQGVDFIIAMDNCSVDRTTDILHLYKEKGLLHYIHQPCKTHDQGRWVTQMARMAYTDYKADWVINNDADEFWWPMTEENLKYQFRAVPDTIGIVEAERRNFVCLEGAIQNSDFYKEMVYRERESYNTLGKPLPPKQAHRGSADITISDGNHSATGLSSDASVRNVVEIFHFPLRSKTQFIRKITAGASALEKNARLDKSVGSTWRLLNKELNKKGNLNSFFSQNIYSERKLESELKQSRIVKDLRLRNYIDRIYGKD